MHWLPPPGSAAYTPKLIRYLLHEPALQNWEFDTSLFTTILLALIVDKGGVIVDVAPATEKDKPSSGAAGEARGSRRRASAQGKGKGKAMDKVMRAVQAVSRLRTRLRRTDHRSWGSCHIQTTLHAAGAMCYLGSVSVSPKDDELTGRSPNPSLACLPSFSP